MTQRWWQNCASVAGVALVLSAIFLASCLQSATADFRTGCETFAYAHMDPIVSRWKRSSHSHHISGSLAFNASGYSGKAMKAAATTCDLFGDWSNYWTPVMFRTDTVTADGKPAMIPTRHRIYYRYLDAFPIDPTVFKRPIPFVVGNSKGATDENQMYPYIRFYTYKGGVEKATDRRMGWPTSASNVEQLQIDYIFPSCWNGIYTYAPDILKYPDPITLECPSTHTIRIPQAQIEARYDLKPKASWTNGNAPFFFSSGWMNTAHADAIFLFNPTTLGNLMNTCKAREVALCSYEAAGLPPSVPRETRLAIASTYVVPTKYLPGENPPAPAPTPLAPTVAPTRKPTAEPTPFLTLEPTPFPTLEPTPFLTLEPTGVPTATPTGTPTQQPVPVR